jgi:hypothetical protein
MRLFFKILCIFFLLGFIGELLEERVHFLILGLSALFGYLGFIYEPSEKEETKSDFRTPSPPKDKNSAIHNSFTNTEKEAFLCCLYMMVIPDVTDQLKPKELDQLKMTSILLGYDLSKITEIEMYFAMRSVQSSDDFFEVIGNFNHEQRTYFICSVHNMITVSQEYMTTQHLENSHSRLIDHLQMMLVHCGIDFDEYLHTIRLMEQ